MLIRIIAVIFLAALAIGCTVRAPGINVKVPGVEIGTHGGGGHCPPGQAKKGRC